MARPTRLLDDLVAHKVTAALERGNGRSTAARLAGIAPSTLYDWLRRGRLGEPRYSEFLEHVAGAEAKFEDIAVQRIQEAANKGIWQAASWLLSRRHPKRWGDRREVTAKEDAATRAAKLSGPERKAKLAELMGRAVERDPELLAQITKRAANGGSE